MKNKKFLAVLFLLSFLAFGKGNDKPIYIEANKMDYQGNVVNYTGNVIATRDDGKLTCGHLTIILDKNKKIQKIIATQDPIYTEPQKLIKGDKIEYDVPQDIVIVTGHAYLQNKDDVVQGDKVIYYRKLDKAIVTGKRVQSIFVPNKKEGKK